MTNNAEFVCFFLLAVIMTAGPPLIYICMRIAILKVILDGIKSILWDYNNRRY
jgi:hypothetical protein